MKRLWVSCLPDVGALTFVRGQRSCYPHLGGQLAPYGFPAVVYSLLLEFPQNSCHKVVGQNTYEEMAFL